MCKNGVKKLPFVIMYVPERYKTQEMCDKAVLENGRMLKLIPITVTRIKKCVMKLL